MAELVSIKRNVDVSPGQAAPAVFHCSQGDVGSKLILGLLNNGTAYSIPSGVTVTIEGSESNGSIFTPISATASGSDITFNLTGEMTAVAGPAICQAVLKSGSNILGTANFTLEVESSPMGADAPPVFTDAGWTWMLNKLTTEFVPALGDNIIDAIESKADQSNLTALSNTVAGHTGSITVLNNTVNTLNRSVTENRQNIATKLDKNQGTANAGKYLKVGTNGNVETADLDVTTDKTLSIADKAADAKAVGDELDDLKADLGDLNNLETTTKNNLVMAINEAAQSGGSSTGITNAVKSALLACFQNVAWATEDGQDFYDALLASMEVPATAISVSPSTVSFSSASETQRLAVSVTPRDSSDTVTWISSNPSVATVNNAGLVTPIANGTCTITATAGTVSDTCSVTVSGIVRSFDVINSLTHVTNSNSSKRVAEGDSYSATLSADAGYWITTVVITMDGDDVTSTAYSNGVINIASVNGEITIYAVALEMTIISTNWTRGSLGNTGSYINQKWYGAEVTDMITMGANQTLVIYSTDPNWTTNYTGTDGNGKTGNNCLCCFYQNASSPSYINPVITVTNEKSILTFSSDTSKVSNYSKTIGARVHVSNLVDNLSSVVVGLIDGVV